MKTFRILLRSEARADLAGITDQRSRAAIGRKIDELQTEPTIRGKPLTGDLQGFYSVRAAGQRYRVIYAIEERAGVVTVVVIGIRKEGSKKDAYQVAQRRLRK